MVVKSPDRGHEHAAGKREEDGDAAESRQRAGMKMTLLGRNRNPAMRSGKVAHVPCEYES